MNNYAILKKCCSGIFKIGSGNFWYEDSIGDDKSLFYRAYTALLFSMYIFMIVLEILAALIGDFPEDEKRDSVTLAVTHSIVLIKIFAVIIKKDYIKSTNYKIIKVCEHETPSLTAEEYKIMKINLIAYIITVYGSCSCYVFEGIKKFYNGELNNFNAICEQCVKSKFKDFLAICGPNGFCVTDPPELFTCLTKPLLLTVYFEILGSHFVTITTYYPTYENDSVPATAVRVFMTGVLFVMMTTMILTVDSLTLVYLIMYKYKFITLRIYFEDLRTECDRLNKLGYKIEAAEKMTQGLIDGIVMHSEVLRLSKEIDVAFGTIMALQVCLSFGSAVSLLLQIALAEDLGFTGKMKLIFFGTALIFLLGLFLCNAGEITYQAALLSDAIFYCGWHACPPQYCRQDIRKLVLLAIMQAQKPLTMKAFMMLELTYGTFISILRTIYSVYALFYAQNQ